MPRYRFDRFTLDEEAGQVFAEGKALTLQPLTYDLLHTLVQQPDRLFTRDELGALLWPDVVVLDESLTKAVSRLRKEISCSAVIRTVPRRGYRMGVPVTVLGAEPRSAVKSAATPGFVGRGEELERLLAMVETGTRVLTIAGPAGVGKTRISREVLASFRGRMDVRFVDLSVSADPVDVCGGMARALNVPLPPSDAVRGLGRSLASLGRAVVVLDNLEQLVESMQSILPRWIEAAPHVCFVCTTRIPLELEEESVVRLAPLAIPDGTVLFAHRAGGSPDDPGVAELVAALDGLPLAIELAAGRARLLTPDQLRQRMNVRFDLLGAPGRTGRHSSLRRALDDSWALLDAPHRDALTQLLAFVRPVTLVEAEAVVDAGCAIDLVQGLMDRSLVHSTGEGTSFTLLWCIRKYVQEHGDPDVLAAAEVRHGRFVARQTSLDDATMLDEAIAASRRAIARGDADVATATALLACPILSRRGPLPTALELLNGALAGPEVPERLALLSGKARVLYVMGRHAESAAISEEALQLAEEAGDAVGAATAHLNLCRCFKEKGMPEEAARHGEIALASFVEQGDLYHTGLAHNRLGVLEQVAGRMSEAMARYRRALETFTTIDDGEGMAVALGNLAGAHAAQGANDEAQAAYREARMHHRRMGDDRGVAHISGSLGASLAEQGRFGEAIEELDIALTESRRIGNTWAEVMNLRNIGELQVELGRYEQARATLAEAIDLAAMMDFPSWEASGRVAMAKLERSRGSLHAAWASVERAARVASRTTKALTRASVHLERAEIRLARGQSDHVAEDLDVAESLFAQLIHRAALAQVHCVRAELARRAGHSNSVLLDRAEACADEAGLMPDASVRRRIARLRDVT